MRREWGRATAARDGPRHKEARHAGGDAGAARSAQSQDGQQWDVPADGGVREGRQGEGGRDRRDHALTGGRLLRPLGRPVAPDDHPFHPAFGPVELERQETQPNQDRDDARAGDARAGHHDARADDQYARDHDRDAVEKVALLVARLALLELDQELWALVLGRPDRPLDGAGCVVRRHRASLEAVLDWSSPFAKRFGRAHSQSSMGRHAPARASATGVVRGSPLTGTLPSLSIVTRLDRSIAAGSSGQGVITTPATRRPAARAASTVSSVWLIVPRPGLAAITTRRARSTARSRMR